MSYLDLKSQERYIRWVNRVLARAHKPYSVGSLRDDAVCTGRALYDVLEHLSGSTVPGFIQIESRRAVLHNLQALLNHVAALKIRMSLIQPADIEQGDLHAILRFLLGVVRHYEPHRVRYRPSCAKGQKQPAWSLSSSQSSQHADPPRTRHARLAHNKDTNGTDLLPSKCSPRRGKTESHRQPSAEKPSTRVMVTDSRVRRLSDSSASGATHSLPRDILEIHLKLKELKQLLSRPDVVTDSLEKRDKWCQTASRPLDEDQERVLHQKDATIAFQKDQLTKLRALLERRVKLTECLSEELSLVKSSSQHARIDSKDARTLDQFLVLLKSIRTDRALKNSDLDKFDEGLNLLTSLSACSRHQAADKTNVAIVNPCSTNRSASNTTSLTSNTAGVAREEPTPLARATPPGQRTTASYFTSPDQAERGRENCNTKMMVYFQGRSPIPYLSVIPLPLSRITLLDVKQSTKSMWSSGAKFRYFFNTIHPDFGPTRQEVLGDEDKVPGIDGKIVVFIQQ